MNEQLAKLLRGYERKYPHKLEERYPRIINQIVELWRQPEKLKAYFQELIIADNHARQGFPKEVAAEIFSLSALYDRLFATAAAKGDVWDIDPVKAKRELESLGIQFTTHNFFKTVLYGNAREVVLFLQGGMDIELRDQRGWTPLMMAAFEGSENMALLLLQYGADAFAQDKNGYMPIHFAALRNYSRVIALLVGKGVDPNTQSKAGITPLLQAASSGHADIVRQLLEMGVPPDTATHDGWTPLHKATANGHNEVVALLMKHHANPYAEHNSGVTPVSIASSKKMTEILNLLQRSAVTA